MQQSDFREAPDWDVGESRPSDLYRSSSSNTATINSEANMGLDRSYKTYQREEKDSYVSEVCADVPKGREDGWLGTLERVTWLGKYQLIIY